MTIPHLFMCPISLDLFTDPVTLCTGQTYDRPSIEKWLAAGNLTCPVTMQKLHDLSVVPNHTLRHLIDQWSLIIAQQIDPEIDYLAALKLNLESHQASNQTKLQSLERLRSLIEASPSRSSSLIQLGLVPSLLNLVLETEQDNVKLIEQALLCFLKLLPLCDKGCLNTLHERSKLASIIALFRHSNVTNTIRTSLCSLVETISSSPETKQLCTMLAQNRGLVRELVLLLHQDPEPAMAGIRAISAFSSSIQTNREILIREGAINALVTYISNTEKSNRKSLAPMAVSTIEKLLAVEGAKEELIRNPDGVYALVKMVFTVSDHEGSESAVSSLTMVCCGSLEAREEAIKAGVLTQLLLLLQSQCNGRTKTKARMLLKLLKSKWGEDTKSVCRYK